MLRDYTAYEIANMTQEQTEALPYGGLKIKFANGEVLKCKTSAVRYSWFYWQLFAEEGTNGIMPHNFIGNEAVTQDKHLEMLSRMFWDVFISKFGVQFSPGVGMTDFWRLSSTLAAIQRSIAETIYRLPAPGVGLRVVHEYITLR